MPAGRYVRATGFQRDRKNRNEDQNESDSDGERSSMTEDDAGSNEEYSGSDFISNTGHEEELAGHEPEQMEACNIHL